MSDDIAPIGNSSFGGCEFGPVLDGSLAMIDQILMQGAAQGQTMFASSGDTGSFCSVGTPNGVPAGVPEVEYPAASPYAVAVGGTTLVTHGDGSYQGEVTWYAGGGGVSSFETAPAWESGVQPDQRRAARRPRRRHGRRPQHRDEHLHQQHRRECRSAAPASPRRSRPASGPG